MKIIQLDHIMVFDSSLYLSFPFLSYELGSIDLQGIYFVREEKEVIFQLSLQWKLLEILSLLFS